MQDTETQDINLLDFQKIGKGKNGELGNPYDILDDKIAEYITTQKLKLFVLNGQPYLYRNGVYKRDEDGKILKAHIKALIWSDLVTIGRINRVYSLILSDYRLTKKNEDINQYPAHWVNFKNGMYDPISQKMYDHSPEYLSINQIPHEYDPEAAYEGTVAEQFFQGLFPDTQDREMFFAFAGYCMTLDTRLQKFMVVLGVPGSGKSTAINMLVEAVGVDNASCITLQDLNERFTPTELLGKLLNACADLPGKALDQVDAIKRITGEDLVKGEYKGGKVFSFRSYAKLIFSANEMPRNLDEKSEAFYRRLLVIRVGQKGPQIVELKKGLTESMPGFLNECMAALRRMYKKDEPIDSPHSLDLVHEFHRESDSVLAFLDDCVERSSGSKTDRTELYEMYKAYCYKNEWTPLISRSFYKNLKGKGLMEHKSHGYYFFLDICPKSAPIGAGTTPYGAGFRQATLEESAIFAEKSVIGGN